MKKGFTLIELMVVLAILGMILIPTGLLITGFGSPNKGGHTGYVTAVEYEKGIFSRNDKFTAYFKTNTQSSQEDVYCVLDKKIIEELKEKQESGERITISYARGWFVRPWDCATSTSVIIGIN